MTNTSASSGRRWCQTPLSFPRLRSVILAAVLISASQQKQPAFSCVAAAATSPAGATKNRNLRRRHHHHRRRRAQQQERHPGTTANKSTGFRCPELSFVPFENGVEQGLVDSKTLSEASGLVASIINPGILWTHNDMGYQRLGGRGPSSTIIASRDDGRIAGTYILEGAASLDYEDIAAGSGPVEGRHYLYVGDIGGAKGQRENIVVYRVAEPMVINSIGDGGDNPDNVNHDGVNAEQDAGSDFEPAATTTEKINSDGSISLTDWDALTLTYPGTHQHNAESLMFDPLTHHLYLISRDDGSIWRTERVWSEEGNAAMNLVQVGTKKSQPLRPATGADVSRDGREVLVKHYASILYYCREPGEDLGMVLSTREGVKVPYKREWRGESIAFAAQRELGYYTLSESGGKARDVPLYRYNRVPER